MSWNEIWSLGVERYTNANEDNERDVGYMAFAKLIGLFTHDFYIYSFIIDLIFYIPFGIMLYRYCTSMKQIIFAFIFYLSLFHIYFLGGARQIIAMGLDLNALVLMIDKKRVASLLLFSSSVFIHFSSLLFLPPLLMICFNINPSILKSMHIVCFFLFPVILMMPNQIVVFMGEYIGMEKYAEYGRGVKESGATMFIILIEILSLFCLLSIKKRDLINNKAIQYFYVMAPFFTIFAPLIKSDGSMIRVSMYFHFFLFILVPYAIECMFKESEQRMAYIVSTSVLAIWAASSGLIYFFYWQLI